MSVGISLEELLTWNNEASDYWKAHLDANPALLALPCDIGGTKNVQEFVRHIWGVELRWAQRLAELPETPREAVPDGPLDALFGLHLQAVGIVKDQLANPPEYWETEFTLNAPQIPVDKRTMSRRKVLGHALFHGQRHWAQLATLVRAAGFPSGFRGDLLLSSALQ
jgi:uncharacterized damage-inducible protein DinB